MGDVIDFKSKKKGAIARNIPHTTGPGVCTSCEHTCELVMPTGMMVTDCPKCGLEKMVRKGHIVIDDPLVCSDCNSAYFTISTDGEIFCVDCGTSYCFILEDEE